MGGRSWGTAAPRDGGGRGRDKASAVLIAHILPLQQECVQLDRLKTQLADAIQRYGVVQKVRLPRETWRAGWGGPRALQLPFWQSCPWVGLVGVPCPRADGGPGL